MFNNLSSKPSIIIIKAFLPVYGNRLPGHDLNACRQLASVVMLFLRVEERGREPGEQEEARGEQEVGRWELLQRYVVHVAVHEDEDKVLDAVYESDSAVQYGSLVLVDGLEKVQDSPTTPSSSLFGLIKQVLQYGQFSCGLKHNPIQSPSIMLVP